MCQLISEAVGSEIRIKQATTLAEAAGVFDDQGTLVAGLSISAPAERLDAEWLPKLRATALEISTSLGYKPELAHHR